MILSKKKEKKILLESNGLKVLSHWQGSVSVCRSVSLPTELQREICGAEWCVKVMFRVNIQFLPRNDGKAPFTLHGIFCYRSDKNGTLKNSFLNFALYPSTAKRFFFYLVLVQNWTSWRSLHMLLKQSTIQKQQRFFRNALACLKILSESCRYFWFQYTNGQPFQ